MATSKAKSTKSQIVEYVLNKGSSRLLNARVERRRNPPLRQRPSHAVRFGVSLTSLDLPSGATHAAWTKLAATLRSAHRSVVRTGKRAFRWRSSPRESARTSNSPPSDGDVSVIARPQIASRPNRQGRHRRGLRQPHSLLLRRHRSRTGDGSLEHDGSLFAPEGEPTDEHTPSSGGSAHAGHTHDHH